MSTWQGPPAQPAVPGASKDAATDLVAWARAADAAYTLAKMLVETAFCPAHFKGKPQDAAASIMFGSELHLSPLQALNGVYMIGGKPALYAKTMVAVLLSVGHSVWTVEKTDDGVTVSGCRAGSSTVETETWTLSRAERAGYTKNAKYRSDPQSMLLARAQSDVCRRVAPDALLGMAYSAEELQMEEGAPEAPARPLCRRGGAVTSSLTAALTAGPEAASAPPAPAPDPVVVEDQDPGDLDRARELRDEQAAHDEGDDADDGYLPGWEPGAPAQDQR